MKNMRQRHDLLQDSIWVRVTANRLALQGKVIILFQDKFSCLIACNEALKSFFITKS